MNTTYEIHKADSPIIALALHDGHYIPSDILLNIKLKEHERFREEDPYTAYMADLPVNKVVVNTSRFYVDLNRAEDQAIYKHPEDAWGLQVWNEELSKDIEKEQMAYYHQFYSEIKTLIQSTIQNFGHFIILDIHSYNHRRDHPDIEAPSESNPEINIGSKYNDPKWNIPTNNFLDYLSTSTIKGHSPDVRKNVKFKGGGFSQWVNQHYSEHGYVLSIEFKKTFMDEWTGRGNILHIQDIRRVLIDSIPLLTNDIHSASK